MEAQTVSSDSILTARDGLKAMSCLITRRNITDEEVRLSRTEEMQPSAKGIVVLCTKLERKNEIVERSLWDTEADSI